MCRSGELDLVKRLVTRGDSGYPTGEGRVRKVGSGVGNVVAGVCIWPEVRRVLACVQNGLW
jgi:hypothetical protein